MRNLLTRSLAVCPGRRNAVWRGLFLRRRRNLEVVAGKEDLRYFLDSFVFERAHAQMLRKIPNIYLTVRGGLSYFEQNFGIILLGGKR